MHACSVQTNRGERGIALVMVLALVALVSVWAVESADEDWISLRRAENMQLAAKSWLAVESGQALAMRALKNDDAEVDSLDEDWALEAPPFPVDEGVIAGRIEDANRYLNLNDLVDSKGKAQADVVTVIKRLFSRLELDPLLVDALVDWMDADSLPFGSGGAEESAYANKPYKIKNAPLESLGELLLVQGFDADGLKTLRKVVMVRPSTVLSAVNINTAPADVLLSLADQIPQGEVEAMISERETTPYKTIADVTAANANAWVGKVKPGWLTTKSDAFILLIEARFERARWAERMLVARSGDAFRVISRRKMAGL
ncbi:MAG: type II secretion system minor pseudopilin GspK [Mariprofundaceae bacterium]|nr:type II secretion system minor pseudopilin GspK [Mariprofundaceae bacterium]